MRRCRTLPFVLLIGGLAGCGAGASRAEVGAAELQAQSARAEAMHDRARLIEIEARLIEMERHWANQTRGCEPNTAPETVGIASSGDRPKSEPLRAEGDFLTEARVVTPAAGPPAAKVAVAMTTVPATPASERERLEQQLEALRAYAFDPRSGLSPERREALRVLLRRDRKLDSMNPWSEPIRRDRQLDLMNPWDDR